jgi:non-ribosomal peptide synthetase component F
VAGTFSLGNAGARPGISEHDLVAVALPPGPGWLELVRRVWAAGAAVLPIDPRLPRAEAGELLRLARPTVLISDRGGQATGRRLEDGVPADPGVALVVHTSGTAGMPKLVQFERRAIDSAVAASTLLL